MSIDGIKQQVLQLFSALNEASDLPPADYSVLIQGVSTQLAEASLSFEGLRVGGAPSEECAECAAVIEKVGARILELRSHLPEVVSTEVDEVHELPAVVLPVKTFLQGEGSISQYFEIMSGTAPPKGVLRALSGNKAFEANDLAWLEVNEFWESIGSLNDFPTLDRTKLASFLNESCNEAFFDAVLNTPEKKLAFMKSCGELSKTPSLKDVCLNVLGRVASKLSTRQEVRNYLIDVCRTPEYTMGDHLAKDLTEASYEETKKDFETTWKAATKDVLIAVVEKLDKGSFPDLVQMDKKKGGYFKDWVWHWATTFDQRFDASGRLDGVWRTKVSRSVSESYMAKAKGKDAPKEKKEAFNINLDQGGVASDILLLHCFREKETIPDSVIVAFSKVENASGDRIREMLRLIDDMEDMDLSQDEKAILMEKAATLARGETAPNLLSKELGKNTLANFSELLSLIRLGGETGKAAVLAINPAQDSALSIARKSIISHLLPVLAETGKFERFDAVFLKSRNPGAITTYIARLMELPDSAPRLRELNAFVAFAIENERAAAVALRYGTVEAPRSTHAAKVFGEGAGRVKIVEWAVNTRISWKDDPSASKKGKEIVNTDDPIDLLLMGTEGRASCLSVNHHANDSKCLIANLIDPKNRLIAIKDESGKIVGRAILRLLWDENLGQAALFLEEPYMQPGSDPLKKEIFDYAFTESQRLGLPLYRKAATAEAALEGKQLASLGSPAGFEKPDSLDSGAAIVPGGIFTYTNLVRISGLS